MFAPTLANDIRIVNVTVTGTATSLQQLVDTALGAKAAPANSLPSKTIVQVCLTSSATVEVSDAITGDALSMIADIRTVFPISDLFRLKLKNAATVSVEIYYL